MNVVWSVAFAPQGVFSSGAIRELSPCGVQGRVQGLALRRVTCRLEWQNSGLDLSGGRFKNKKA